MKEVYFVRHGETEGNTGKVFQGPDTPLNEKGMAQASVVAERCAKLDIDVMYASTMTRAHQTASVISERIGKTCTTSDLFTEVRRPTSLMYRSTEEADAREMNSAWARGYRGEGPKVEDGEHFDELIARVGNALQFLKDDAAERILVVTHGLFLRALFARLVFGAELTPAEFKKVAASILTDNTGISMITWSKPPEFDEEQWIVRVWNDRSHFA